MSKRRLDGLYDSGGQAGPQGPAGPTGPAGPAGPTGPTGQDGIDGGGGVFSFDTETNAIVNVPPTVDQFLLISDSVPKFGYSGDTFLVNLRSGITGAASTEKLFVNEALDKFKVLRVDTSGSGKTFLTGSGTFGEPILLVNAKQTGMKHVVLSSPDAGNALQPVLALRGDINQFTGTTLGSVEGYDTISVQLEDGSNVMAMSAAGTFVKTSTFRVGPDPNNIGPSQDTSLTVNTTGVSTSKQFIVKDAGDITRVQLENNGNINCLNLNNSTPGSIFYNSLSTGLTSLPLGAFGSILRVDGSGGPAWVPPPSAIYWNSVPGANTPTLASPWVQYATPFFAETRGAKLLRSNPTPTRYSIQALDRATVRLNYTITVVATANIDFSVYVSKIGAGLDRTVASNYDRIEGSAAAASISNNKTSTLSSGFIISLDTGDEVEFLLSDNFSGQIPVLNLGVTEI